MPEMEFLFELTGEHHEKTIVAGKKCLLHLSVASEAADHEPVYWDLLPSNIAVKSSKCQASSLGKKQGIIHSWSSR